MLTAASSQSDDEDGRAGKSANPFAKAGHFRKQLLPPLATALHFLEQQQLAHLRKSILCRVQQHVQIVNCQQWA
jgi:hypothetical protein